MSCKEISIKYSNDIINGIIPSCLEVKQTVGRFLSDIKNPDYYFDEELVNDVISFINLLDLTEQVKPKKFYLEPWQTFIISNLYGLINKETGFRKYKYGYIELGRKNGKSQLATALSLYHLLTDTDAQVIISANSLRQVKEVDFKKLKQFSTQLDKQQKDLKQYYNSIKYGDSELLVTASDASKLDGLNISFCLIDEFHEAKDNKLYNVFKSAMGNRDEPMFLIITTAGFDTTSYCYQLRTYYQEILNGSKIDDEQFVIIYTIDEDDKENISDNSLWVKANPNLGVSLKKSFLKSEVIKALNNEIEKPGVLVKNFNYWLKNNTIDSWLPDSIINQSLQKIKREDFKDYECWVGVDLSEVSDITAVSYLIQLDDKFYFFNDYYLPEDNRNTNENRELFKSSASNGYMKLTDGNVVDYDYILRDILQFNETNPITELNYDKRNAIQFAIDGTEAGLNLKPFSQLPGNLNKPLKEFERLIKSGRIIIEYNPLTSWMFGNVIIKRDRMGNYSIDKSSGSKKIDGIASMINALGGYLESPRYNFNIY